MHSTLGVVRTLKPSGRLVFPAEYPSSTFVRGVCEGDGNYFETKLEGMERLR